MKELVHPPKLTTGDKIAILSPSFAAPAAGLAVHEQAMEKLVAMTGLIPVEYPTTRMLGASPESRAADFNAALADSEIRGIFATIGGSDQIRVVPFLNADVLVADPKPFFGYSDNTNILNWMWNNGVASFYGGSTQVQIGPGPDIDTEQKESLLAALFSGDRLEITDPGTSQDFGVDWADPAALTDPAPREASDPWEWAGPQRKVSGPTWGGCLDVVDQIAFADRMPSNEDLEGCILILETSERLATADTVRGWVRSLGERGTLDVVKAVVFARSPASAIGCPIPSVQERAEWRAERCDAVIEEVGAYNPEAVVCVGPPFGHTSPQWILPYGGEVTVDGQSQKIYASYS